jgi:hypothetical protein
MTITSPASSFSRCFARSVATFGLAFALAVCLLPASINEVRGQTVCVGGVCASCTSRSGTICCSSPMGYTCEPDPNWRGRVARPRIQRNVTRLPPRAKPHPAPRPTPGSVAAPTLTPTPAPTPTPTPGLAQKTHEFEPTHADQIQPLRCPTGFTKTRETFYGGSICGPVGQAKAASAEKAQSAPTQPSTPETPKPPPGGNITAGQTVPFLRQPAPGRSADDQTAAADDARAKENWKRIISKVFTAPDEAAKWEHSLNDIPAHPFVSSDEWSIGR